MARTKNFAEVVKRKLAANRGLAARVEEHAFQSNVAEQIYNARNEAGLTQTELAARIGSHQSVVARLEDADYEGHTLSMLRRIGDALGKTLHIEYRNNRFVGPREPVTQEVSSAEFHGIRWAKMLRHAVVINQPTVEFIIDSEHETAA